MLKMIQKYKIIGSAPKTYFLNLQIDWTCKGKCFEMDVIV